MNTDARVTLYGGAAIGIALYVLGAVTVPVIGLTGIAFMGTTLFVSALFDHCFPA